MVAAINAVFPSASLTPSAATPESVSQSVTGAYAYMRIHTYIQDKTRYREDEDKLHIIMTTDTAFLLVCLLYLLLHIYL